MSWFKWKRTECDEYVGMITRIEKDINILISEYDHRMLCPIHRLDKDTFESDAEYIFYCRELKQSDSIYDRYISVTKKAAINLYHTVPQRGWFKISVRGIPCGIRHVEDDVSYSTWRGLAIVKWTDIRNFDRLPIPYRDIALTYSDIYDLKWSGNLPLRIQGV